MKLRALAILSISFLLINCQSTPLSEEWDSDSEIREKVSETTTSVCTENNESEDCLLILTAINYELPDEPCQPYEHLVEINTRFFTPAGLKDGSLSRLDWEFLPNGNAGFWFTGIENKVADNSSGSIEMAGCFTFGDQQTLKITRTIQDELGNESNALTIEIPNPVQSKAIAGTKSEFVILDEILAN